MWWGAGGDRCAYVPLSIVLEGDEMPMMEMPLELEKSPSSLWQT